MRKVKKRRSAKKRIIFFAIIILIILSIWAFLSYNVNPVIVRVSKERVTAMSTMAINSAISKAISEFENYVDILEYKKNSDGDIELIQVNTLYLNTLVQEIIQYSQENISQLGAQGIDVPLGSLSGLTFLSGRGPSVKIKVHPVGSISKTLESTFVSAGINQTRHQIYMNTFSSVDVVMPGINRTISTNNTVILIESIIIGKIPDTYLNFDYLNEKLNLVP